MVRDIYQMVIERDMVSEVMMISLDYELIDFFETNYPKIKTGYLCYFSFGDIATLNCDVILMEAEVASSENIGRIHAAGKEAGVWTVNMLNAMTSFMASDIDYIITD
jgi:glycerophosphoryl diester phosphodiesterase